MFVIMKYGNFHLILIIYKRDCMEEIRKGGQVKSHSLDAEIRSILYRERKFGFLSKRQNCAGSCTPFLSNRQR